MFDIFHTTLFAGQKSLNWQTACLTMMAQGSSNGEMRLGELIPTHFAAASNDIDDLARLVREGSPLIDPKSKETPLHAAAQTGANETLTWLLVNKKASPLDTSQSGSTAAHLAVVYGHLEALKVSRLLNPIHPIGNGLKKQKPCTEVWRLVLKAST